MIKDIQITVTTAFCDNCGEDLQIYNCFPYYEVDDHQYCPDCAYKLGHISKKEWCKINGICLNDRYLKKVEIPG